MIHNLIKLLNINDKEQVLKAAKRKHPFHGNKDKKNPVLLNRKPQSNQMRYLNWWGENVSIFNGKNSQKWDGIKISSEKSKLWEFVVLSEEGNYIILLYLPTQKNGQCVNSEYVGKCKQFPYFKMYLDDFRLIKAKSETLGVLYNVFK